MEQMDPHRIRQDFPVFAREIAGKPIAFFDGPGGSQVPRQVADAVAEYLTLHNANTHGQFATSDETDAVIGRAREAMADFVGGDAGEIVFGANMTTLTLHLSRSLGREWAEGDEVVVTALDHQANVAPWRMMAEDAGMTVRVVPFDPETLQLDYGALESLLSSRTRLLAIGAASNAVGTINDVRRAAEMARAAGALTFVDAVHYAPHRLVDVRELGCDFLACSAYKFFGPHAGVLWGRRELLEGFRPYRLPPAPSEAPGRWETGTQNHEGLAGLDAAIGYLASLGGDEGSRRVRLAAGYDAIAAHERELARRFLTGLEDLPHVRLWGIRDVDRLEERTPTFAIRAGSQPPAETAKALASRGIFVWDGDYYAREIMTRLGLLETGGAVRIGFCHYHTTDEVDRVLEGLRGLR